MNILLVCGAGASTSYLVTRMEKVSKDLGRDDHIWAIAQTALKFEIDKADVILLGPQITFMLDQVKDLAKGKGIPDVYKRQPRLPPRGCILPKNFCSNFRKRESRWPM